MSDGIEIHKNIMKKEGRYLVICKKKNFNQVQLLNLEKIQFGRNE